MNEDARKVIPLIAALGGGGGGGGGAVDDVKIDGTSVVNSSGIAEIPIADSSTLGVIKPSYGLTVGQDGDVTVNRATDAQIKVGTQGYNPIDPYHQHTSVFYGLAKAAGDSTQSASANAVGTYTETAKSKISDMLNAPETVSGSTPSITAKPGVQYICGEVSTIDITVPASGIIDVIFESGSTPAVLTITPPTGQTMKFPDWFDEDNLEADKTYEINISNGTLAAVMLW